VNSITQVKIIKDIKKPNGDRPDTLIPTNTICNIIEDLSTDDEFLVKVKYGDFEFLVDETEYIVVEEKIDNEFEFVLHYRLTRDIEHPIMGIIAQKGEPVLLSLDPDEYGYKAQTQDGRVSFYVNSNDIEEDS
jgi:hypothetical protein